MNLVFDNWDENGNPIPNFIHIENQNRKGNVKLPFFIDDNSMGNIKINYKKLQDVNKNEKFYYIISHMLSYGLFLKNNDISFTEEIEYHIKNNEMNIVFLCNHESPEYQKEFIVILNNKIKIKNWNSKQFFLINNNSLVHNLDTEINVFKIDYLIQMVSNKMKVNMTENDIKEEKRFLFLCQNQLPHIHRIVLLTMLKNNNLLNDYITDWSLTAGAPEEMKSLKKYKGYLEFNESIINDYKYICGHKKLSFYETDFNWFHKSENYRQLDHIEIKSYQNSFINIVTETHFEHDDVHITEKSFKPFYYFQIPIFVATHNHVKMIRNEYGFDLYDDLIDHSYDFEKDNVKRLKLIFNEIERLSKLKEEISLYYKCNRKRFINNHTFIKNYGNKKILEKYFLNY